MGDMFEIQIDEGGIIYQLDMLAKDIGDIKGRLADAEKVVLASIDKNFKAQGRPPWTPMAESTKKRRRKGKNRGRSPKLLQDTGTMRESIRGEIAGDTLTVAANVDYAHFHQQGTGRIPARPFMTLQEEDVERIAKMFLPTIRGFQ